MSEANINLRVDVTQLRAALRVLITSLQSQVSPINGVRFYPSINVIDIDETYILRSALVYLRNLPDNTPLIMRKAPNSVIYFETREETFRDIVEAARKAGT